MLNFWNVVYAMMAGDVIFWIWADRRLARLRRGWPWRVGMAVFMLLMLVGMALTIRYKNNMQSSLPMWGLVAVFVWHVVVLPPALGVALLLTLGGTTGWVARRIMSSPPPPRATGAGPTRRQLLSAGVAMVPPVLAAAGSFTAYEQVHDFRIRKLTLTLPQLPPALDGLTIAHVTDLHAGKFARQALFDRVVERTNALDVDLIAFTGDLVDASLAELPPAIEMIKALRSRYGTFVVEGNHDLYDNPSQFRRQCFDAGVSLLLNQAATVAIRGELVQILGIMWSLHGEYRHEWGVEHLNRTLELRNPRAFPILLTHHPHEFDPASDAGVPLTLAGHTHGGQIVIGPFCPAARVFRYLSGVYQRQNCNLVVSNGVGNWFPLRIGAPAEIIHLTLKATVQQA